MLRTAGGRDAGESASAGDSAAPAANSQCKSRSGGKHALNKRYFQDRWSPISLQRSASEPPITPVTSSVNLSSSGYCTPSATTPADTHAHRISRLTLDGLGPDRLLAPRNAFFASNESLDKDPLELDRSPSRTSVDRQSLTKDAHADDDQLSQYHSRTTWDDYLIPLSAIKFKGLVNWGRFGQVYQANHFGKVAVRFANMQFTAAEERLEMFKRMYDCYRTARHPNLVFFCGYTVDESQCRYGIVTEYFTGPSLYQLLHEKPHPIGMQSPPDVMQYAVHICQAMSYLNAKGIVHRDLRSKNVFISDNRAVVTDFAIFELSLLPRINIKRLAKLPREWMCYMAPELLQSLTLNLEDACNSVTFTEHTDVFAFGTIWYELFARKLPYYGKGATEHEIQQLTSQLNARDDCKSSL